MTAVQCTERPILFSGPMVGALLNGTKTETRRVVKPQPNADQWDNERYELRPYWPEPGCPNLAQGTTGLCLWDRELDRLALQLPFKCPYGKPGDRLWVKETWAKVPMTAYWHDPSIPHRELRQGEGRGDGWWAVYRQGWDRTAPKPWRPSIFMPRWASRISREVVSVRIQHLQEISEEDALKEGIEEFWTGGEDGLGAYKVNGRFTDFPLIAFEWLWDSINGETHPWKSNPQVWVVTMKDVTV